MGTTFTSVSQRIQLNKSISFFVEISEKVLENMETSFFLMITIVKAFNFACHLFFEIRNYIVFMH